MSALKQQLMAKLTRWLSTLQPRELRVVLLLALVMITAVSWQFVLQPLQAARTGKIDAYQTALADLQWMQRHAGAAKNLPKSAGQASAAIQPIRDSNGLLSLVTDTAATYKISITNAQPAPDGTLQMSMDRVSFFRLLTWLESLQKTHGVTIDQMAIEKIAESPGYVSARVTLKTGD